MVMSITDVIPYSSLPNNLQERIIYLEIVINQIVEAFSTECLLPTDSIKYRVMEQAKHSLRGHKNLDVVSRSKILEILDQISSNPPGFNGIQTEQGILGNTFIDLGWRECCRVISELVKRV